MQNFARKILGNYGGRSSRLHTPSGNRLSLAGIAQIPTLIQLRFSPGPEARLWMNLDVQDYLGGRVRSSDKVLEIGSGSSTLWWAKRCHSIVALEDDMDWASNIKSQAATAHLANVQLSYLPLTSFVDKIDSFEDETFDIIVVDCNETHPTFRLECAIRALPKVRPDGIVVLDDSERTLYNPMPEPLASLPRRIFRGMKPFPLLTVETCVFGRTDASRL